MSSKLTSSQNAHADHQSQEVDLVRLLGEMVDHWKIILCVTLVFAVLAGSYVLLTTPIYQADAMVQVEQKQENYLLKNLASLNPGLSPDTSAEKQLLQSRLVLGKTVSDLHLDHVIQPVYFPVIGKVWARVSGQKPGKLDISWMNILLRNGKSARLILTVENDNGFLIEDEEGNVAYGRTGERVELSGISLKVKGITAEPGTRFSLRALPELEAINQLKKRFTVTESGKDSGMLTLTLTGPDGEMNAQTLNSIANNYLQQNIERQAAQDSKSLAFLQRQMPQVRRDLDQAEERLNGYRKKRDSVDLNLEAKSVLEQIVNADKQLNELTFREAEISQLYKKDHPIYRALTEKRQTLEQEKDRLTQRVTEMPSTQQEIIRLSREVDTGHAVYLQLLTRQQELTISKSSTVGNVRIIDGAVTQPEMIKPRKAMIVILGILFGFILSVGVVLLRAAFRKGIETPEQLEDQGIGVYATLPRSAWLANKTRLRRRKLFSAQMRHKTHDVPFLPLERPMDLFVEAIRGLRTSLHFSMMEAGNNVLMVTGATQDCGKTLVSTSLAAVIAQAGKRVLFIDADMRRGYSHNIFMLNNDEGLSSILAGEMCAQEAIQHFTDGGFDVLTRGQTPTNPAELLMHERFKDLITWANEHYDVVLVDTPPVLAVTDALLVGRQCASTLLVARFGVTSIKEVLVCTRRLQMADISMPGVILNDVIRRAANIYRTGYSDYGYSYGMDRTVGK